MRSLGLLAILAGATPCAPAGSPDPGNFPFGTVQRGCAPWDGAATIFVLSNHTDSATIAYPWLQISVWHSPDALHGDRIELSDTASSRAGTARYCRSESDCLSLVSGWVSAGAVTDSRDMQGSYDLQFDNQEHQAGQFKAQWRETRELCG